MGNLTTEYAGIELRNPLVVGAAGVTGRAELVARAADAGAGAVVMKSLGDRHWRSPRFALLTRSNRAQATTFYTVEGHTKLSEEEYAEEVARARAIAGIPVIASITCLNDDDWVRRSRLLEQAGASGLELDISCPHGAHVLIGRDSLSEVGRVTALVKSIVSVPVIPKLTPQANDPLATALEAQSAGADAITMFNRFTGLDVDIREQRPILHGGLAGHGGPWAIYYVMRWISAVWPHMRIPISSSGGVFTWEDAVKMLLTGATAVQTCTAVILNGYDVVTEMVNGLNRYMDEMGHRTLGEVRGLATQRLQSAEAIDRTRHFRAEIDATCCTDCGECAKVCIYDAPSPAEEGGYQIGTECVGCGLCSFLCPTGAIAISEIG